MAMLFAIGPSTAVIVQRMQPFSPSGYFKPTVDALLEDLLILGPP